MRFDPKLSTEQGKALFREIRHKAMKTGANSQSLSIRFALERTLHRLFSSEYADRFALKGGLIMMYAEEVGPERSRATEDIDLHIPAFDGTIEEFGEIMRDILSNDAVDDGGLVYDLDNFKVARTREGAVPGGSLSFPVCIGDMHIKLKLDVGFDRRPALDVAIEDEIPSIMPDRFPPIKVKRIPFSWTVADKIQATVRHGDSVSRFKDFYDLYVIMSRHKADPEQTAEAMVMTFDLFDMPLPDTVDDIRALSPSFGEKHVTAWRQEMIARRFAVEVPEFQEVVAAVRSYIAPILERAHELKATHLDMAHDEKEEMPVSLGPG